MKIEIVIDDNENLPIVKVDGEFIEGMTELNVKWETNSLYILSISNIDKNKKKIINKGFESI